MSLNKIFLFLISPPPPPHPLVEMLKYKNYLIAKHVFECFEKRKGEDGKK